MGENEVREDSLTERVERAGQELGDLVVLALDDISNRTQIAAFTSEGFEAIKALADATRGLPADKRKAAASHLLNALHAKVNAVILPLE